MMDRNLRLAPASPQSLDGASPRKQEEAEELKPIKKVDLSAMSITSILNDTSDEVEQVAPIAVSIETVEMADTIVEPEAESKPRKKYQRRVFIKQTTPPAKGRTRGDYVLTPLLLSEPEMAWIQCTNCSTYFVQQNAYVTRSSCPRCERHSRLYGYVWPKTEKAGASDKEERILDHRVIHRFLDREDELRVRGRKSLLNIKDSAEAETKTERGAWRKKAQQEEPEDVPEGVRRSHRRRTASSRLSGVVA
jgi:histone-lysine N-methyltransferase SUV420H